MNKVMRFGLILMIASIPLVIFGVEYDQSWLRIFSGFIGGVGASLFFTGNFKTKINWREFWRKWGF